MFSAFRFFAGFCGVLLSVTAAHAEVKTVTLAADYADFALDPASGDVCAVAAEANEVVLLRGTDLAQGKSKPAAKLRVGSTPCSVFFKQFGDKRYFAVVCSQDAHMYLVNAKDGTLAKKFDLGQSGVSYVTGSINPADPFVYFNYGGGHGSAAGAVNLRTMTSHADAFGDSMDCAISASGKTAYRRGPWSPSGFESLTLAGTFADEKPRFLPAYREHDSTEQYYPDPFDRFTAAGESVYTNKLNKKVAGLPFVPQLFLSKRPVVIGVQGERDFFREGPAKPITLAAASYNTFTSVGEKVTLLPPSDMGTKDDDDDDDVDYGDREGRRLPRGVDGSADFKFVGKRARILADEEREQLLYADRTTLALVPLADFELPQEPFLYTSLKGSRRAVVGRDNLFTFEALDPKVTIVYDDLPVGMEATEKGLKWRPGDDQVGPASIVVTLKSGDLERSSTFDIAATMPSLSLPFRPFDFTIGGDGKKALLWEGPSRDVEETFERTAVAPSTLRMAILDLTTGKATAETKLSEPVREAIFAGEHIAILTAGQSPKCDLFKLADLKREKSLVTASPIERMELLGKYLMLVTGESVDAYELGSFARAKTIDSADFYEHPQTGYVVRDEESRDYDHRPGQGTAVFTKHGVITRGILYDAELKPALLLNAMGLPLLPGVDHDVRIASLKPLASASLGGDYYDSYREGPTRLGRAPLANRDATLTLEARTQSKHSGDGSGYPRTELELAVTLAGDADVRQVLLRDEIRPGATLETLLPRLHATAEFAFVSFDRELFRWKIPAASASTSEEGAAVVALETGPRFVPRQSALALSGEGRTTLTHEASGGKAPLKYTLLAPFDSLSIDETSGAVTIDEVALEPELLRAIERSPHNGRGAGMSLSQFREQAVEVTQLASAMLGRKPKGTPVAIPIRVDVTDAESATDSLQYFVLAEVPNEKVVEHLTKLEAAAMEKAAAREASKTRTSAPGKAGGQPAEGGEEAIPAGRAARAAGDIAALSRRIESLEGRIDLLTRQLNTLLKSLDEQDADGAVKDGPPEEEAEQEFDGESLEGDE